MQQYDTGTYEQLGGGAAFAAHADDGSGATVRVVPITEGERTIGHRENGDESPAIWDPEPLREAVEQGALDGSLIIKGTGGTNPHFAMDEQVPPENILGRVDEWEYEPGTGPVGYAQLADDDIADRIELGLLEVSGDWLRRLGEYDSDRGGKPVTEVIDLPRVHVLERGAAQGASIEMAPETAEALGYNPDAPSAEAGTASVDGSASSSASASARSGDTTDDDSAGSETIAQHATEGDAVRWESDGGGQREPSDYRYGVVVNPAPEDSPGDWMVAVYQATADFDGWEPRNETQPMNDDRLERVGGNGVDSLPAVSQVVEQDAGLIDRLASRVVSVLRDEGVGVEQHAVSIHEPSYSDTSEGSAPFADGDWGRPSLSDYGADDPEEVADYFLASESGFPPESYSDLKYPVVYNGTLYRAALRAAASRLGGDDDITTDEESRLRSLIDRLADDAGWDDFGNGEQDAEQNAEQDAHSDVDEPAESGTGADVDPTDDSPTDSTMTDDDTDLREQLASVKNEKEQLASEKEDLREQLADTEDDLEDTQEQLAAKEETIEQKNERIETLEEEVAPLKSMLAEIAAGDSMLDPDRIAETHDTKELVDLLADDAEEEETSYTDKVREQLAATVTPRGDAGSDSGETNALDEQQALEAEQLAEKVMTAQDWKLAEDFSSNREYLRTTKGVDPARASSETELREQIKASGGEQ